MNEDEKYARLALKFIWLILAGGTAFWASVNFLVAFSAWYLWGWAAAVSVWAFWIIVRLVVILYLFFWKT